MISDITEAPEQRANGTIATQRLTVAVADEPVRQQIYRIRHQVYALELGQHPVNAAAELRDDLLEGHNVYIVVRDGDRVVGFVSITPPHVTRFSFDRHLNRDDLPFAVDESVFEVRLLTVVSSRRGSQVACLLLYAAWLWVAARGGRRIVAIGRREVMSLYQRIGMRPLGLTVRSGAVTYEAMHAPVDALRERVHIFRSLLKRLMTNVDWQLDISPDEPPPCYHGGAFFDAIGDTFETLERKSTIINADVLDAWFDPSPNVITAMEEHFPWLLRTSPPTGCGGLVRSIAEARGVDAANIMTGAGSSDLIYLGLLRWLKPSSRVLILDPMYGEYAHVLENLVRCRVDRFTLRRSDNYDIDPARLGRCIRRGYDLVVLVNPNSPTGRHLGGPLLQDLIDRDCGRTRYWIDETYVEYVGTDQSLERYAAASRNVVVCKSMSKVYALSGARVAYLCGPATLIDELRAINPPWAVSLPGQVAAVHALRARDYYQSRYAQTHLLRQALARDLRDQCGMSVVERVANFLLCHLEEHRTSASQLVDRCRAHGLFIRDVSNMGATLGCTAVRIAVKDRATNDRMIRILRRLGVN